MPLSTISNGASSATARSAINAAINTLNAAVATGTRITGYWAAAPTGYVLANGSTIGSASSGATRANADTADLFALLWNNLSDALAPVNGGRGASASADFAANKTITLPDETLRVPVMHNGGASSLAGVSAILGAVGGLETHTLIEAELPIVTGHTHGTNAGASTTVSGGADETVAIHSPTTASDSGGGFGSGQPHNNVQPFICINVAIKL
jgi:hypothetical protein